MTLRKGISTAGVVLIGLSAIALLFLGMRREYVRAIQRSRELFSGRTYALYGTRSITTPWTNTGVQNPFRTLWMPVIFGPFLSTR